MFYTTAAWLVTVLGVPEHAPYPRLSRTMSPLRRFGEDSKHVDAFTSALLTKIIIQKGLTGSTFCLLKKVDRELHNENGSGMSD